MKIAGPKLEIDASEAGRNRAFATSPILEATDEAVATWEMDEFDKHFLSSERVNSDSHFVHSFPL